MGTAQAMVASQIIPLKDTQLLLPNTAVAEIIDYAKAEALPTSIKNPPDWLIGILTWRGVTVPLLSFEAMLGGGIANPGPRARIAVVNAIGGKGKIPFYAVATQGIPRLVNVNKERIQSIDDEQSVAGVHCKVMVDGEAAMIPDLEEVEVRLATIFKGNVIKT